mgnify:CR=1 FL=1|tara:strand:- start:247 stop:666 length:420 start_codon:yes stop_codon:yes gene_type:complete
MKSILLILSLSGCTASSAIQGFHIAHNDCGPVDELIVAIKLGLDDLECEGSAQEDGLMHLSIYSDNIRFGDQYTIGQDMSAMWCVDNICEEVVSGNIEVTAYEDWIAVSGFYDLTLADTTNFSGEIAAEWCDLGDVICG